MCASRTMQKNMIISLSQLILCSIYEASEGAEIPEYHRLV